jgi:hypothetical protein
VAAVSRYQPFTSDGHAVAWSTWDGAHREDATIRWENEGFTVVGQVSRERIQYVVRLGALWNVRQFLLFRDLDEPDLWLANDGTGHWGEMNGAHRDELEGCVDIDLLCTPLTLGITVRRLGLAVGQSAIATAVRIDPDTLQAHAVQHHFHRIGERRWRVDRGIGTPVEFDVDEFGLVLDYPAAFRRESSSALA